MKRVFAVLSVLALLVVGVAIKAQVTPEQHSFTLYWQPDTSTNSTEEIFHLRSFDSQPVQTSVCGQSPEGYTIWCGEIEHYATGLFDFNFQTLLLPGCSNTSVQSNIVYTSATRRVLTEYMTFACVDSNTNTWSVQTTRRTNQYRAWCRFRYCWGNFEAGLQSDTTGTATIQ